MNFNIDIQGSMEDVANEARARIAKSVTAAMRDVAGMVQNDMRAAAAKLGAAWQNSIVARVYPRTGNAIDPACLVSSGIPEIMETGGDIFGRPLMWLPLTKTTGNMNPRQYARTVGPLRTLRRPGKPPLLAAVIRGPSKPLTLSKLRRGTNGLGAPTVIPLFVGVPRVHVQPQVDAGDTAQRSMNKLPSLFDAHMNELGD